MNGTYEGMHFAAGNVPNFDPFRHGQTVEGAIDVVEGVLQARKHIKAAPVIVKGGAVGVSDVPLFVHVVGTDPKVLIASHDVIGTPLHLRMGLPVNGFGLFLVLL